MAKTKVFKGQVFHYFISSTVVGGILGMGFSSVVFAILDCSNTVRQVAHQQPLRRRLWSLLYAKTAEKTDRPPTGASSAAAPKNAALIKQSKNKGAEPLEQDTKKFGMTFKGCLNGKW